MAIQKVNNERIFGLDLVRAAAILFVVFSHIYYLIGSNDAFLISLSGLFGYLGVEMFFVLSGFLIGGILLKLVVKNDLTFTSLLVFLKRRWFRTLPNYYLVLFINVLLSLLFNYYSSSWWNYLFFGQNLINHNITFFTESWSLSVEEWSYIILPIVLFFCIKLLRNFNKKYLFLIVVTALILLFHFIRFWNYKINPVTSLEIWNVNVKSVVINRIDTILFGFILAWLHYFYASILKKYSVYLFIISLHLFVFQFFLLNAFGFNINASPLYYNVIYFTLSSSIIFLAMPVFIYWKSTKTILSKPVTFISKISYSVYLLHYSIISYLLKYFFDAYYITNAFLIIFLYLLITLLSSFLLYHYFEKPIMDLRDKNQ